MASLLSSRTFSSPLNSKSAQGRVFRFSFNNSWWGGWTVDGVMILNGKAGPVLALNVLLPPSPESLGSVHSSSLLAISIPRQVLVFRRKRTNHYLADHHPPNFSPCGDSLENALQFYRSSVQPAIPCMATCCLETRQVQFQLEGLGVVKWDRGDEGRKERRLNLLCTARVPRSGIFEQPSVGCGMGQVNIFG